MTIAQQLEQVGIIRSLISLRKLSGPPLIDGPVWMTLNLQPLTDINAVTVGIGEDKST